MADMLDKKVWTVEDLEQMTPNERFETLEAGLIMNLDEVPPEFMEHVRADIRDHIAENEGLATGGPHESPQSVL